MLGFLCSRLKARRLTKSRLLVGRGLMPQSAIHGPAHTWNSATDWGLTPLLPPVTSPELQNLRCGLQNGVESIG